MSISRALAVPAAMSVFALSASAVSAASISALEDGFFITGAPDAVSAASSSTSGGYGPPENVIDGDLSTGFPNLSANNDLTFSFTSGLLNAAGDDLLIVDGRYDSASISITIGGTTLGYSASDFYNTGVTDALTSSSLGVFPYTAFALRLDISDFGVAVGDSISSFVLSSSGGGFDPIDVATISESGVPVVPLPASFPLVMSGLLGLGLMARRKRQV